MSRRILHESGAQISNALYPQASLATPLEYMVSTPLPTLLSWSNIQAPGSVDLEEGISYPAHKFRKGYKKIDSIRKAILLSMELP